MLQFRGDLSSLIVEAREHSLSRAPLAALEDVVTKVLPLIEAAREKGNR